MDYIGTLNYMRGDIGCVFVLFYIMWLSVKHSVRRDKESSCFIQILTWMMIYILSYSLSGTFKYGYITPTRYVYSVIVMLVMISQTMVAYKWFCYSEIKQRSAWRSRRMWRVIFRVPVIAFTCFSVLSVWTGWIFYIDSNLSYHRGRFFLVQYVLVALYMGITSLNALRKSRKKEYYVRRNEFFSLFEFIIPPAIATALQSIIPMGIFMVGIGFAISMLMVYMRDTRELVSQDGLTKLNNRTHMSRFLSSRMSEGNDRLYLLILDANSFKTINDTYGHIEGDNALMCIAKMLTVVARDFQCYISRYGGDEFILIYESDSEERVKELCNAIHKQMKVESEKIKAPYEISVSVGYSKYNSEQIRNIPDFIQAADKKMMENKNKYHGARPSAAYR